MVLLHFYRMYASLGAAAAAWLFFSLRPWAAALCALGVRFAWFAAERRVNAYRVKKHFVKHVYEFKQQLGPYGIRLANMAENDRSVMKSLDEVFTPNEKQLRKNVDQLRMLDTLFSAGMRPDAQTYQIHDCTLKYGMYRLEQMDKNKKT